MSGAGTGGEPAGPGGAHFPSPVAMSFVTSPLEGEVGSRSDPGGGSIVRAFIHKSPIYIRFRANRTLR
jgi:hypothetical protein